MRIELLLFSTGWNFAADAFVTTLFELGRARLNFFLPASCLDDAFLRISLPLCSYDSSNNALLVSTWLARNGALSGCPACGRPGGVFCLGLSFRWTYIIFLVVALC